MDAETWLEKAGQEDTYPDAPLSAWDVAFQHLVAWVKLEKQSDAIETDEDVC